jgi:hypothetical protein
MTHPPDGDPLEQLVQHPLLGRQVRVTLAYADGGFTHLRGGRDPQDRMFDEPGDGREVLAADVVLLGELLNLRAGGDVAVRQDDGQVMNGWPALRIDPR